MLVTPAVSITQKLFDAELGASVWCMWVCVWVVHVCVCVCVAVEVVFLNVDCFHCHRHHQSISRSKMLASQIKQLCHPRKNLFGEFKHMCVCVCVCMCVCCALCVLCAVLRVLNV